MATLRKMKITLIDNYLHKLTLRS